MSIDNKKIAEFIKSLDSAEYTYMVHVIDIMKAWHKYKYMNQVENNTINGDQTTDDFVSGLNKSASIIFENNKAKGFWDNERNVGELLMLVTSELGEAMEAHRKRRFAAPLSFDAEIEANRHQDDCFEMAFKLHIKDTFEDEIADAIIRLLDLSAGLGIDIERHIRMKVQYNQTRPRLHGKSY